MTNQDKICFRHSGKDREVLSFFIGSLYVDTCCLNLFIRAVTSKMWPRHLIHSETIVLKLCWFSASKQVGTCHSQCADNIYCLWTDWKDASCVLSLSPMVGVALWMHTGREREREREGQRIFKESSVGLNLIDRAAGEATVWRLSGHVFLRLSWWLTLVMLDIVAHECGLNWSSIATREAAAFATVNS